MGAQRSRSFLGKEGEEGLSRPDFMFLSGLQNIASNCRPPQALKSLD